VTGYIFIEVAFGNAAFDIGHFLHLLKGYFTRRAAILWVKT